MKTALLGPKGTGKSTAFFGFFLESRHVVTFPDLTAAERAEYLRQGIDRLAQIRLSMPDAATKKMMTANAAKLLQTPMQFPDLNAFLDKTKLELQFDFLPLADKTPPRVYPRSLEIYDPTGGALTGQHDKSDAIVEELVSCDTAIVFLSAADLLEAAKAQNTREHTLAGSNISFVDILEPLKKMQARLSATDIFPFCVVISQCDRVNPEEELSLIEALYAILTPISKQHPAMQIGICPISVKSAQSDAFDPVNLLWPFLFAAMGVEQRRARLASETAAQADVIATAAEQEAERLKELYEYNKRLFLIGLFFTGETFHKQKAEAITLRAEAARKAAEAQNHHDMVKDINAVFRQNAKDKGLSILHGGVRYPAMQDARKEPAYV